MFEQVDAKDKPAETNTYEQALRSSWVWSELYLVRNIRPAFRWGLWPALIYSAIDSYVLRGRAPWTFRHKADHEALKTSRECRQINYPKPDGEVSFDRLSSVYLSNTNHEENQPVHLRKQYPKIEKNIEWTTPEGGGGPNYPNM